MRITGGELRSRAIKAPRGTQTRPTSDRVREALFSMLVADGAFEAAEPARVLDLYAGSGALAFEALSRGATVAVLVDDGRDAVATIRENVRALALEARVTVVASRVDRALARADGAAIGPFDLVFCDPPYADVTSSAGRPFRAVLEAAGARLSAGGTLVLEHSSKDVAPDMKGLQQVRSRKYGDTAVTFYARLLP